MCWIPPRFTALLLRHELRLLKTHPVKHKFTSTLLAAVLILSQLVFLHHAIDLSSHADGEACELCLLSAGLDQALEDKHQTLEFQSFRGLTVSWPNLIHLQPITMAFLARAPPPNVLST
jgi:hypothetical protein